MLIRTRSAWTAVILLTAMYAVSYVDRLILGIIAPLLTQSIPMSDIQIGWLAGSGFALLYALTSLPLAQGVDNYNRKRLLLFGVSLWSAMTIASAFATSFATLLIARSGVAMGEAVLTPAAVSLISDLFPRERRALPTTVFSSMAAIMSTGSFVIGGATLLVGERLAGFTGLEPWRWTLVLVGLPGVILALLFALLVREPPRGGGDDEIRVTGASIRDFFAYLAAHWRFYAPLMLSSGGNAFFIYAVHTWVATILVRAHHLGAADASLVFGALVSPLSLLAIYAWPWLVGRWNRRFASRGIPLTMACAALLLLPAATIAPLSTSTAVFIGGMCIANMCAVAWGILPLIVFQSLAPTTMVGRLAAINLMLGTLVGYGLGPPATVYLGERLQGAALLEGLPVTADPLARGLAANGLIAVPLMLVCTLLCLRSIGRLSAQSS